MECAGCRVPKLSAEFPSAALVAAGCPMRRCLRCIRAGGSGPGGGGPDPALVLAELSAVWCPIYGALGSAPLEREVPPEGSPLRGAVIVSFLDGRQERFAVDQSTPGARLKEEIGRKLDTSAGKLRLFHDRREIGGAEGGAPAGTWGPTDVPPGGTIQVVVVMYEVAAEHALRSLTFELSWTRHPDSPWFVNGTCFAYKPKRTLPVVVDWSHPAEATGAIKHSGASSQRNQTQSIGVHLDNLQGEKLLAFVLSSSARGLPLSMLRSLSVRLLDAGTQQCLAEYTMAPAGPATAAILCFATLTDGRWRVVQCGHQCDGHHKAYAPVEKAIGRLAATF